MTLVIGHRVIELLHWAIGPFHRAIGSLVIAVLFAVCPTRAGAQTPAASPATTAPAVGSSRLFYAPTGRMLAPGQGYVAFDAVFMVTVEAGVTKWFSIGAGTSPVFWFVEDVRGPFWVTPKVQIYAGERTSVAAGAVAVFVPGVEGSVGLGYVVSTTGTAERSFTIGGAFGYLADDGEGESGVSSPLVIIGGERRVSPRVSVITENWVGAHGGFVTLGVRRHGRRMQGDVGLALAFGGDFVFPGIVANFAVKFGTRR